ncbi:L,D-transpeptidase family protein [Salinibacter grassmerensis]|uniref:L,D-transpeptidase family protein n=1 Tax=Salinibacter grassmerensis TaxID=3040353 RepID=UPI0021E7093E|nr:L,D-transpeptidase family protein [Salinibacter grassmerensis]
MRTTGWVLLLAAGLASGLCSVAAQPSAPSDTTRTSASPRSPTPSPDVLEGRRGVFRSTPLFYVAGETATLHNRSGLNTPVTRLSMRTPVRRLSCEADWCRVRTDGGTTGYVAAEALSNMWIRVSKRERRIYVYRGAELVHAFQADMAYNSFADKKRNGGENRPDHWRTPEGTFYVVHKNPQSEFYKALVLNYPKVEDARRGLDAGLISRSQYEAIRQAQQEHRMPPMGTDLGGWIEIHGDGTGDATAWTQGCVAIRNAAMDVIWEQVRVGTPVLVE